MAGHHSGYAFESSKRRAVNSGNDAAIHKPFLRQMVHGLTTRPSRATRNSTMQRSVETRANERNLLDQAAPKLDEGMSGYNATDLDKHRDKVVSGRVVKRAAVTPKENRSRHGPAKQINRISRARPPDRMSLRKPSKFSNTLLLCRFSKCRGVYFSHNDLARHEKIVHKIYQVGDKLFVCPVSNCSELIEYWPHWDLFEQHMKDEHSDDSQALRTASTSFRIYDEERLQLDLWRESYRHGVLLPPGFLDGVEPGPFLNALESRTDDAQLHNTNGELNRVWPGMHAQAAKSRYTPPRIPQPSQTHVTTSMKTSEAECKVSLTKGKSKAKAQKTRVSYTISDDYTGSEKAVKAKKLHCLLGHAYGFETVRHKM